MTGVTLATPPPGMVLIPAGAFAMGNSIAADTDITDAAPVSTTVSAYYMDVNEVTLSQWQSVYYWAKDNGYPDLPAGSGKGPNHPVHTVNWYAVVKWCNARSEQAGKTPVYYTNDAQTAIYIYRAGNVDVTNAQVKWTASGYRLPTEAEWEKAARGGRTGQRFPWGEHHHAEPGELLRGHRQPCLRPGTEWLQRDWECGRNLTGDESSGIVCAQRVWAERHGRQCFRVVLGFLWHSVCRWH